ncbi:MAG: TIGR02221 family CRISPR-associated protein [Bacillota bacterium]
MARVLISSIGTGAKDDNQSRGKYKKTVYEFEGSDKRYETSFISAVLCECLQVDKLYLIGTAKSMWEEVYHYFATASNQPLDDLYWVELGGKAETSKPGNFNIDNKDLEKVNEVIDGYLKHLRDSAAGGSRCYIIDYGLNEKELWSNFDVFVGIGDSLQEGDEVFLDITHAFRSIPLFNYLMLDLIGILKFKNDFKIGGLFYGMLEANKEMGYAPIVDLGPLYKVTQWARGAYNFMNFGNGYLLAELINDNDISTSIRNISDIVNINYINDFKKEVDRLNGFLEKNQNVEPVVNYMQPYLKSFIDKFKGISSSGDLQLALAKWYFDSKRFAQGYICLAESIVTKILELYRDRDICINWSKSNRDKIRKKLVDKLSGNQEYKEIYDVYTKISKIRNWIAHAGFTERRRSADGFKENIDNAQSYVHKVEKLIFKNKMLEKLPEKFPFEQL